jgi:hypothetical protein
MFFLLCALAVARPATTRQDLTQQVTYKSVAEPAARAVADIAKLTHTDLAVIAPLDKEPIIIRLKDATLKDAMDQLAYVLDGTWVRQKTGFTLQRTDAMQQTLVDNATQTKAKKYADSIKSIIDKNPLVPLDNATVQALVAKMTIDLSAISSTKPEDTEKFSQSMEEAREQQNVGSNRLCREILGLLDPQQLAADPYPDNIVLSNAPRPLQRKLDISNEDLQQMVSELNLWFNATHSVHNDDQKYYAGDQEMERAIDSNDVRIIANIQPSEDGDFLVNVTLVNSKDEVYIRAQEYFSKTGQPDGEPPVTPAPDKEKLKTNPYAKLGLVPVKLSPEAQEIRVLVVATENHKSGTVTRPATKAVQDLLLDPIDHDPLSWAPSEVLLGIGDQKDWNVIARLPDIDQIAAGSEALGTSDPANFLLQREDETDVTIKSGWLTLRPKDILTTEKGRTDRTALGQYAKAIQQTGYSTIEAEADFYAGNQPGVDSGVAGDYALLINPDSNPFSEGTYGNNDPNAMRFYGLLGPDLRAQIQQGRSITANQLDDDQREALAHLIMDPPVPDYSALMDEYTKGVGANGMASAPLKTEYDDPSPAAPVVVAETYSDDPTEFLNTAPPNDSIITATAVTGHAMKMRYEMAMDAQVSDTYQMEEWVDPVIAVGGGYFDGSKSDAAYAWGDKRDIHLVIKLSDTFSIRTLFTEHKNNLSVWGSIANLPPDIQKAIEDGKKMRSGRQVFGDGNIADGSGAPPPPSSGTDGGVAPPRT